jgi:hypothetical protein
MNLLFKTSIFFNVLTKILNNYYSTVIQILNNSFSIVIEILNNSISRIFFLFDLILLIPYNHHLLFRVILPPQNII